MTTKKIIPIEIGTKELFASYDKTTTELLQLVSSFSEKEINTIPYEDNWTAAQVATHITKSNTSIAHAMHIEGKAVERNAEERVQELKDMFLDFSSKFKSPEFILPTQDTYQKETVIEDLKKSIMQLKNAADNVNLFQIINVPAFGEITKLEIFHFVLYHTQRHIHQLKNIFKIVKNENVK